MLDIVLLKLKKKVSLDKIEQEFLFSQALHRLIDNTDEVAYPFIKLNMEHLLCGYVEEEEFMSASFIEELASMVGQLNGLSLALRADAIYFIVRYLLAKRKKSTAMRFAVLFLEPLTEEERPLIDKLTLDYLEYFASAHDELAAHDQRKELLASIYTQSDKLEARTQLTPEFLDNPFHPHFRDYDVAIHRILAMSSISQLKNS